jgi:hypothetical protein
MQSIEIPELPTLRGENAIKALNEYIKELEGQNNGELTKKQTQTLIKLSQGLISVIETETHSVNAEKQSKSTGFVAKFKKTILRYS